jgi:hypothetical protein
MGNAPLLFDPEVDQVRAAWPRGVLGVAIGLAVAGVLMFVPPPSIHIAGLVLLGVVIVLGAWALAVRMGHSVLRRSRLHRREVATGLERASQLVVQGQDVPWTEVWAAQVRQHFPDRVSGLNPKSVNVRGAGFVSSGPELHANSDMVGGTVRSAGAIGGKSGCFRVSGSKNPKDGDLSLQRRPVSFEECDLRVRFTTGDGVAPHGPSARQRDVRRSTSQRSGALISRMS